MNLLERLKPHYREKLAKNNIEFPYLVAYVTDSLEELDRVTDLPYGVVLDLQALLGHCSPFNFFEYE